jgi:hypothetical protein
MVAIWAQSQTVESDRVQQMFMFQSRGFALRRTHFGAPADIGFLGGSWCSLRTRRNR